MQTLLSHASMAKRHHQSEKTEVLYEDNAQQRQQWSDPRQHQQLLKGLRLLLKHLLLLVTLDSTSTFRIHLLCVSSSCWVTLGLLLKYLLLLQLRLGY